MVGHWPTARDRIHDRDRLDELRERLERIAIGATDATRAPYDTWEPRDDRRPWRHAAIARALAELRDDGLTDSEAVEHLELAVIGTAAQRARAVQHAADCTDEAHPFWDSANGDVVARATSYAYLDSERWQSALSAGEAVARRYGGVAGMLGRHRELVAMGLAS